MSKYNESQIKNNCVMEFWQFSNRLLQWVFNKFLNIGILSDYLLLSNIIKQSQI